MKFSKQPRFLQKSGMGIKPQPTTFYYNNLSPQTYTIPPIKNTISKSFSPKLIQNPKITDESSL